MPGEAPFQAARELALRTFNARMATLAPGVHGSTRAVFGEGPVGAAVALVGEQPGDQEDRQGRPFVGPAGRILNRALSEVGLLRAQCYVTNAVKHFKFVERGKRRLHQKPAVGEIRHYRWWLLEELDLVAPHAIVALGATAVAALNGHALPVNAHRGETVLAGRRGVITVHPSYLLRIPGEAARQKAFEEFVADLRRVTKG